MSALSMPLKRSPIAAVGAVVSVVALYLWDDLLFAAPIIAGTRWLGALPAFLLFSIIYSVVSFGVALWAVRVYDRRSTAGPSRFARWVERQGQSQRSGWVRNLLLSGRVIGFVASSVLIGGIVTTFLIRYSGRTDRIVLIALVSCVLFGVTFAGFYSGIGRVVFGS